MHKQYVSSSHSHLVYNNHSFLSRCKQKYISAISQNTFILLLLTDPLHTNHHLNKGKRHFALFHRCSPDKYFLSNLR